MYQYRMTTMEYTNYCTLHRNLIFTYVCCDCIERVRIYMMYPYKNYPSVCKDISFYAVLYILRGHSSIFLS